MAHPRPRKLDQMESEKGHEREEFLQAAVDGFEDMARKWRDHFLAMRAERDRLKAALEKDGLYAASVIETVLQLETKITNSSQMTLSMAASRLRAALATPSPKENTRDSNK